MFIFLTIYDAFCILWGGVRENKSAVNDKTDCWSTFLLLLRHCPDHYKQKWKYKIMLRIYKKETMV